ncbi:MAG TPA: hypothetical protein VFA55_02985, partial [Candidatus Kapabacteria bacterium]|nr:hypothetical protein [Candidatus Kapabacteria bacterium]
MITQSYLQELEKRRKTDEHNVLRFTEDELTGFTPEDSEDVIHYFRGQAMMYLPQSEIEFFEWVKENDPQVWLEMWSGEDEHYTVSIASLRAFIGEGRGFLVCDLDGEGNYYFHKDFIIDIEKEKLLAELLRKVREKSTLTI